MADTEEKFRDLEEVRADLRDWSDEQVADGLEGHLPHDVTLHNVADEAARRLRSVTSTPRSSHLRGSSVESIELSDAPTPEELEWALDTLHPGDPPPWNGDPGHDPVGEWEDWRDAYEIIRNRLGTGHLQSAIGTLESAFTILDHDEGGESAATTNVNNALYHLRRIGGHNQ